MKHTSMIRLVGGLGTLVLLSGCGVTINTAQGGGAQTTSSSSVPSRQVSPSSSSPSSPVTTTLSPRRHVSTTSTVTLPVTVIPTSFGGSPSYFQYPSSITVTVPKQYASKIQAVGGANFVIISPKGWQGTASEGADGSRSVILYPPGGSPQPGGPRIIVQTAGGCTGCAWSEAAPYFSWVRQYANRYQESTMIQGVTPVATYHQSSILHDYQFVSTRTGLHVNGVAYAPFIQNPAGQNLPTLFRNAQTIFPVGQHALATVILNNIEQQFVQNN